MLSFTERSLPWRAMLPVLWQICSCVNTITPQLQLLCEPAFLVAPLLQEGWATLDDALRQLPVLGSVFLQLQPQGVVSPRLDLSPVTTLTSLFVVFGQQATGVG